MFYEPAFGETFKYSLSSQGMALVSYFLATTPDVQEQLYREIGDAVNENNGDLNLDYNVIQSLQLLDQVQP
jgi:hypothetical protein